MVGPFRNAYQFKGMRRFSYFEGESLVEDARRSPYYWWWAYLRLSRDYWWVCVRKGVADDKRLREMYRDFGDVFSHSFRQWWRRRGQELFREQFKMPEVRRLDARDLQLSKDFDRFLLLEIPLHLTERTITMQLRKHLRGHEYRQVERISTATRPLAKHLRIDLGMIQIAHEVWRRLYVPDDLTLGQRRIGVVQGVESHYEVGVRMRLVASCMPKETDNSVTAKKRVNGMKVAVSRMKTRANNLIANAAVGAFPVTAQLKEPILWRPSQQRLMAAAIDAGKWRPLFEEHETLSV